MIGNGAMRMRRARACGVAGCPELSSFGHLYLWRILHFFCSMIPNFCGVKRSSPYLPSRSS